MKINSLTLQNFSSFEGINEFDFSISEGKNIVLIGGQNGAGKTSIFSAIKVALYGPLAYGYVGANTHYTQKIKELINNKVFQKESVEAGVIINISVKVEREYADYEISRKWNYTKQRLEESYEVRKDDVLLTEQDLAYFQNYLQSIIPPSLFDFFMFDGEEVGNVFSTNTYNSYVKNALFKMCDMDVFEIIRKYTGSYISKDIDANAENAEKEYRAAEKEFENIQKEIEKTENDILELKKEKEAVSIEIEELNAKYKKAGGISKAEKEKLDKQYSDAEKLKQEANIKIRAFVEGLMPFYIVKDFIDPISSQLDYEEKGEIFYYAQQKIKKETIVNTLQQYNIGDDGVAEDLIKSILDAFRPKGYSEKKEPIHDLSKEDIGRVNGMFNALEDLDVKSILDLIEKKKAASKTTIKINRRLRKSMAEQDVVKYETEAALLNKKVETLDIDILNRECSLADIMGQAESLATEKEQKYQALVDSVQNKNVYKLSTGISNTMGELLDIKLATIKEKLEKLIVENLHKIYRKENLITHIEIEDNFQFDLYQNVTYLESELLSLINNLGSDEVTKIIGKKGTEELLKSYNINSINVLKKVLEISDQNKLISTYKRIDLNRLSKGERQIFILSLYWSMIMISGKDIPFIIDTPYARIDTNHRKEISIKFFPNISKQVIILSTDEEINREFYGMIKPYVSKEYLLNNNENENKTTVENRYFFEVE